MEPRSVLMYFNQYRSVLFSDDTCRHVHTYTYAHTERSLATLLSTKWAEIVFLFVFRSDLLAEYEFK